MNVPSDGVIRCPKDCPERKPGCHNAEKCECWAKQMERRNRERDAKWNQKLSYPKSWAARGMLDRKGELRK